MKNILALAFMLTSLTSLAAIDLVGSINESSIKILNYNSGGGDTITDIHFDVEVTNDGSEEAEGLFYLKPALFSLSKDDHIRGAKGATLESEGYYISIAAGETKSLTYHQTLPNLPNKNYGLFVILNSRSTIDEISQLNNNTKVIGIGELSSVRARKPIGFDFYTEINKGEVKNISSRASSGFRTVGKGNLSYFPSSEIDDNNLWARFLLFDYETYEVHTMIYSGSNPANVEKRWCCLPWRSERDAYGARIGVDYYSQAPSFNHVQPGDYLYLSVINSRDLIQEDTLENNLDMFPFNISSLNSKEKRAWFSVDANNPQVVTKSITIVSDFAEALDYSATVSGVTGVFVEGSGTISRSDTLTLTFDPSAVDSLGDEKGNLEVSITRDGEVQSINIPISIFVNNETDTLTYSENLAVTILQSEIPEVQKFILTNNGAEVVVVALDINNRNHEWMSVTGDEISLMSGQSIEVDLSIDHFAKGPGSYTEAIVLNISNSNQTAEININARILAE